MNSENKKRSSAPTAGFLTIITVFVIISLVTIGGLSLSATSRGSMLTDKSNDYYTLYRSAYNESELRLAQTDGYIALAAYSGLFDINFPALIEELDYLDYTYEDGYYFISCETPINDKNAVYWEIKVSAFPADSRGSYELISRRVIDIGREYDEDEHINVWLG